MRKCLVLICLFSVLISLFSIPALADTLYGLEIRTDRRGNTYFYKGNEKIRNQFIEVNDGGRTFTIYISKEGKLAKGYRNIGDYHYHFDEETGAMSAGEFVWRSHHGNRYYGTNGHQVKKTTVIDGKKCVFNNTEGELVLRVSPSKSQKAINKMPVYAGQRGTDYLINEMVKKAGVKKGASDEKNAKKAYIYLTKYFKYYYETKKLKTYHKYLTEEQALKLEKKYDQMVYDGKIRYDNSQVGGFRDWNKHVGVCDDFSSIFTLMLQRVGMTAGRVGGKINNNSHSWCWAKIKGKKYYFDPGTSIHYYTKNKKINYSYYKMTKKDMKGLYKIRQEY